MLRAEFSRRSSIERVVGAVRQGSIKRTRADPDHGDDEQDNAVLSTGHSGLGF
jgi:hypothetical protein